MIVIGPSGRERGAGQDHHPMTQGHLGELARPFVRQLDPERCPAARRFPGPFGQQFDEHRGDKFEAFPKLIPAPLRHLMDAREQSSRQ